MLNVSGAIGLAWVYEQIEDRLTGEPLSLNLPDRIDPMGSDPASLAHRGVIVRIPTTANTGAYRDDSFALASDRVEVSTLYRIKPHGQRASRAEAIVLEEQVRRVLVDETWQRDLHLAYVETTFRDPHPNSAEFYLITQVFSTQRDAQLGGM